MFATKSTATMEVVLKGSIKAVLNALKINTIVLHMHLMITYYVVTTKQSQIVFNLNCLILIFVKTLP